jgi:uncharacterized protein DUF3800
VHFAYFDEVKYHSPSQPYQWLAALIIDSGLVPDLEGQVAEVAVTCFGSSSLAKDTEFHASAIFNRTENFKTWNDPSSRIDVLKKLFRIIDRHTEVGKVYARLEPARMVASDNLDHRTFMFFTERVDMALRDRKSAGLLVGDFESDRFSSIAAADLSRFRATGTPFEFGKPISHLIDTVYFAHSHHSRMLQLADCYAWALQLCATEAKNGSGLRHDVANFVRSETRLLHPHRYKEWPTEASRIQKSV